MRIGILFSLCVFFGSVAAADQHKITPETTETKLLACKCVSVESGCTKISDLSSGAVRIKWQQKIHLQAGKEVDLSEACWRKRDVDGMGNGLCCSVAPVDDAKTNLGFFWGELVP